MNLENYSPGEWKEKDLALEDRWILSRLNSVTRDYTSALDKYRMHEAASIIYHFTWHEFCDWYLELIKSRIAAGGDDKATAQRVLAKVLEDILALLHPIMPYITEELYSHLKAVTDGGGGFLIVSSFPEHDAHFRSSVKDMFLAESLRDIVTAARDKFARYNVTGRNGVSITISVESEKAKKDIEGNLHFIERLTRVSDITVGVGLSKPADSATGTASYTYETHQKGTAVSSVSEHVDVHVVFPGFQDVLNREKARHAKEIGNAQKALEGTEKKLANKQFLAKAPAEVVEQAKAKKAELTEKIAKLKESLESLK
jgi:valyl-tRNA synthetase